MYLRELCLSAYTGYNIALNEMLDTLYNLMLTRYMNPNEQNELYNKLVGLVFPLREEVRKQLLKNIEENIYTTNDEL